MRISVAVPTGRIVWSKFSGLSEIVASKICSAKKLLWKIILINFRPATFKKRDSDTDYFP